MKDDIHTDERYCFDLRANFEQAASPLAYRMHDRDRRLDEDNNDGWCGTPYQVADAGHRQHEAFALIDAWLDAQGG